jgi:hypothetical protein
MADGQGRLPRIGDDDAGRLWPITDRDPADIRDSLSLAAAVLDRREWAPWGLTEEVLWLTSNDRPALQRAHALGVDDRRVRERRTLAFRAVVRADIQPQRRSLLPFPDAAGRRRVAERRGSAADRRVGSEDGSERRTTQVFAQTGYVTSATGLGDHLVLDAGPHGYLNGGHAHADALAVVLTVRHRPLLIDPGTPTYTMDPTLRDSSRSSISHNTVTIDGRSSALPEGAFRWRTRADARLEMVRHNSRVALIAATHDGYPDVGHRRIVLASDYGYLLLDQMSGEGEHQAAQHWHLDPRWRMAAESSGRLRLTHESGEVAWLLHEGGDLMLTMGEESSSLGWSSPAYGVRVPSWSVRILHHAVWPFTAVTWCGVSAGDAVPTLERIRLDPADGAGTVAVRVSRGAEQCVSIVRPGDPSSRNVRPETIGGIETDARAVQYAHVDGVLSSACLVDGTYLRCGSELTIEVDGVSADLHVSIDGDRLDLSASVPPARLRLTGSVLQRVAWIAGNGHTLQRLDSPHCALVLTPPDWLEPVSGAEFQDQHDVRYRRIR